MKRLSAFLLLLACGGILAAGGAGVTKLPKGEPAAAEADDADENAAIKKALAKRISFDFVETPLGDVMGFFRGLLKVNIVVDPALDRMTAITMKVKDMRTAHALAWVAELAGAKMAIEKGVVYIAVAEAGKQKELPADNDPDTQKVKKILKTKAISFDFVDTPLRDVVSFMAATLDVTIMVDPQVPEGMTVTLKLNDVKAASALHWIAKLSGARLEVRRGAAFLKNARKGPKVKKEKRPKIKKEKPQRKPHGGHL